MQADIGPAAYSIHWRVLPCLESVPVRKVVRWFPEVENCLPVKTRTNELPTAAGAPSSQSGIVAKRAENKRTSKSTEKAVVGETMGRAFRKLKEDHGMSFGVRERRRDRSCLRYTVDILIRDGYFFGGHLRVVFESRFRARSRRHRQWWMGASGVWPETWMVGS